MADKNDRLSQNAQGAYYVDSSCVDCDMCRTNAPDVFQRDDDSANSFVYQQPKTAEQIAHAEECRLGCPSNSIGNDGD